MALKLFSAAKINLYLHLTGKCQDYYHLDSIISFTKFGDELVIQESAADSVNVAYCRDKLARGKDNILWKALDFARKKLPHMPVGIRVDLHKKIPVRSGFGGGSSNAASLISAFLKLWNPQIDPIKWLIENNDSIVKEVGADVPSCVVGHLGDYSCKIQNAGHIEKIIKNRKTYQVLLMKPSYHGTCTRQSFGLATSIKFKKRVEFQNGELVKFCEGMENQLLRMSLETREMEKVLRSFSSCRIGLMSGSGSGCFGIFESVRERNLALEEMRKRFSNSWLIGTEMRA